MAKNSAGLLLYRFRNRHLEVFLVHPGGPYWANKDLGAWSMPKGEYSDGEDPLAAAKREFYEETGFEANGEFRELAALRQPGGKRIKAWAFQGDCDAGAVRSNNFTMEWPPRSGLQAEFPEIDRAEWFGVDIARKKILKGQIGFVDELCVILSYDIPVEIYFGNTGDENGSEET